MEDDEIFIDEKNRRLLMDLLNAINNLQDRMNLICSVIMNRENKEGDYILTPDCSKLIKKSSKD